MIDSEQNNAKKSGKSEKETRFLKAFLLLQLGGIDTVGTSLLILIDVNKRHL